ncbi:BTB/POZ domain-containing protein At2g13690 [Linum perenne]
MGATLLCLSVLNRLLLGAGFCRVVHSHGEQEIALSLHCQSESRMRLFKTWFGQMLQDFGWIQRCKKGLDMKVLEEAMSQSLLTLALKMQHSLFMEWFSHLSKHNS